MERTWPTCPGAASRVLELNLEFNPRSALTLFALAQLRADAGDKDQAIELYRRGLEIMPATRRPSVAFGS